jgi:hypothetical protein
MPKNQEHRPKRSSISHCSTAFRIHLAFWRQSRQYRAGERQRVAFLDGPGQQELNSPNEAAQDTDRKSDFDGHGAAAA